LSSTRTTPGPIQRVADLYRRSRHVIHEGAKFLIVGGVGIGVTNLVFIPLHGWPPATRTLVWRTQRNSARVDAFIDTATASQPKPRSRLGTPGYGDWPGPRDLG